jgi:hypothetical protein
MGFPWKGPNVAKIKHHSLTGRITLPLMHHAFRNVRRNRGAAGIDRESSAAFEVNLEDNLLALMRRLKDGSYKPVPLRRVWIPKGQGQTRPLGILAVRDRVAQEVVRLLLSPLFERLVHDDSYGFRPDRNCHMAVRKGIDPRAPTGREGKAPPSLPTCASSSLRPIPLQRPPQALLERERRLVAQVAANGPDIRSRMTDVAGPRRAVCRLQLRSE